MMEEDSEVTKRGNRKKKQTDATCYSTSTGKITQAVRVLDMLCTFGIHFVPVSFTLGKANCLPKLQMYASVI